MFKLAVACFLATVAYAAYYEELAAKTILEQNSKPNAAWKAGYNRYFRGKSLEEMKRLMGTKLDKKVPPSLIKTFKPEELVSLPSQFTAGQDNWPNCASTINFIKDQADCGGCWAVAASEVIGDRICIANMGGMPGNEFLNENQPAIDMSAADILSCCSYCGDGCGGGYPIDAMRYWKQNGVPTGGWYGSNCGCSTWQIPPCGPQGCSGPEQPTPACSQSCRPGYSTPYSQDKHKATNYYQISSDSQSIMQEIYTNGPVECGFTVYSDFMSYTSGVYDTASGTDLGGHAVKIIGWGNDPKSGDDYWLINNSWNVTWGMNGQVMFLRGQNLAGIESQCVAGTPSTGDSNFQLTC